MESDRRIASDATRRWSRIAFSFGGLSVFVGVFWSHSCGSRNLQSTSNDDAEVELSKLGSHKEVRRQIETAIADAAAAAADKSFRDLMLMLEISDERERKFFVETPAALASFAPGTCVTIVIILPADDPAGLTKSYDIRDQRGTQILRYTRLVDQIPIPLAIVSIASEVGGQLVASAQPYRFTDGTWVAIKRP